MTGLAVTPVTIAVALVVAALVGFLSALVPSYHASHDGHRRGIASYRIAEEGLKRWQYRSATTSAI